MGDRAERSLSVAPLTGILSGSAIFQGGAALRFAALGFLVAAPSGHDAGGSPSRSKVDGNCPAPVTGHDYSATCQQGGRLVTNLELASGPWKGGA